MDRRGQSHAAALRRVRGRGSEGRRVRLLRAEVLAPRSVSLAVRRPRMAAGRPGPGAARRRQPGEVRQCQLGEPGHRQAGGRPARASRRGRRRREGRGVRLLLADRWSLRPAREAQAGREVRRGAGRLVRLRAGRRSVHLFAARPARAQRATGGGGRLHPGPGGRLRPREDRPADPLLGGRRRGRHPSARRSCARARRPPPGEVRGQHRSAPWAVVARRRLQANRRGEAERAASPGGCAQAGGDLSQPQHLLSALAAPQRSAWIRRVRRSLESLWSGLLQPQSAADSEGVVARHPHHKEPLHRPHFGGGSDPRFLRDPKRGQPSFLDVLPLRERPSGPDGAPRAGLRTVAGHEVRKHRARPGGLVRPTTSRGLRGRRKGRPDVGRRPGRQARPALSRYGGVPGRPAEALLRRDARLPPKGARLSRIGHRLQLGHRRRGDPRAARQVVEHGVRFHGPPWIFWRPPRRRERQLPALCRRSLQRRLRSPVRNRQARRKVIQSAHHGPGLRRQALDDQRGSNWPTSEPVPRRDAAPGRRVRRAAGDRRDIFFATDGQPGRSTWRSSRSPILQRSGNSRQRPWRFGPA